MARLPRVIVYDHTGALVCDLNDSEVISLTTVAELNGEHSLSITTTRQLSKGDRILFKGNGATWNEYVVESIVSTHETASAVIHEYWCPWSLMHDLSGTYVSSMPGTGGTPATATQALTAALAGTARWTVGTVDVTTTGSASFYRMSGWEALQELIKVWGGEVRADILVDDKKVIARYVSLLQHIGSSTATRRFDYGYDVSGIVRTVEDTLWTARVIPLGAAQQSTNGGYGRKIDISSVNGGSIYLTNSDTANAIRVPNGNGGWEYPVQIVENQDMQTPADLKAWALAHLDDWTTPTVSYEIDVVELDKSGELLAIAEGDEVVVVDSAFVVDGEAIRLSARCVRIDEDVLVPSNSKITISNLRQTLGDTLGDLSLATVGNNNAITNIVANLGAITTASDTISVPSGTGKALCSVTLDAGTWLIEGVVEFAANSTGVRAANLNIASGSTNNSITGCRVGAASSGTTDLPVQWVTKRTAQTTIYLNAYQNSGGALSVTGYLRAMRIT